MIHEPEFKLVSVAAVIIGFSSLFVYAAATQAALNKEVVGKYIVVLKDTMTNPDQAIKDIEKTHGVSAEMRYMHVIKGFSAKLSYAKLSKMQSDPRVLFISEDRPVSADGKPAVTGSPQNQEVSLLQVGAAGAPSGRGGKKSTNPSASTSTAVAPTVTTQSATGVTATGATLNGYITATGGAYPTTRGFVWGTNPTLAGGDTATATQSGTFNTGSFTNSSLTFVCNTTYYSRAFAANSVGLSTGAISSPFITSSCTSTTTLPAQPAQVVPSGVSRVGAGSLVNKGTGIGVAVIDTGIDLTHPDLIANLSTVTKNCVSGVSSAQDDNGHGTHVAGIIAAANNAIGVVGVAPEAKLYAVKVLDSTGWGYWSTIICGIDWISANAQGLNIKVANMSLVGTGTSDNSCGSRNNDALHRAICNSVQRGVTYVVAAGNDGADVSQSIPASYDDAVITVSALTDYDGASGGWAGSQDDTFGSFGNYGFPVDIGAPGVSISSTWKGGTYRSISGTSMATPHVAGAAALFFRGNPSATWTQVRDALRFIGEPLNSGHTDPSNVHPEPVLKASTL